MNAQTQITKRDHLAHLALLYAIWNDEVRSEALRAMMRRMSQQNREIEQQSLLAGEICLYFAK